MKKALLYLILMTIVIGCNGQSLDLSTIDFDKPAEEYPLDKLKVYRKENQNGHWEIKYIGDSVSLELKDNGERVIKYVFMDEINTKGINYAKLPIDPILGASVYVYNDKVSYIRATIYHTETFKLLQFLLNKLGEPTEIIENNTNSVSAEGWDFMQKNIPQYVKKGETDWGNETIFFPQYFIWVKGNVIYQLTLEPVNRFVSNTLMISTKKALKDRVIMSYKSLDDVYILGKYLK